MVKFEKVKAYPDAIYPKAKTEGSAGFDFYVVEDTVVPSWGNAININVDNTFPHTLEEVKKYMNYKPTLVPTGIKCYMDEGTFLMLCVRSSLPLKSWLMLANGVGIIDRDYVDNPDNEGHIYFQLYNMGPCDILLKKGDCIGQGIILPYQTNGEFEQAARAGGFGSTDKGENK